MVEETRVTDIPKEVSRVYRVYKTIHELVKDRGYNVLETVLNMGLVEFYEKYGRDREIDYSALGFIVSKPNNDVDRLFVFFPSEESVGVDPIRKLTQRMMQNSVNHAIIVYRKTITSSANKVIATLAGAVKIEQFQESELLVNITKHELVPKHLVMSDEEKKVLLSRYRLKETQLPRIQHSDPVARYYGLARGQVVKIIRNSETAGRYVTYRICM